MSLINCYHDRTFEIQAVWTVAAAAQTQVQICDLIGARLFLASQKFYILQTKSDSSCVKMQNFFKISIETPQQQLTLHV